MPRFILRYTGQGPKPESDVNRLLAEGQARVVDASARMVLVEGPEDALRAAVATLDDWNLSAEEKTHVLPDPHAGAGQVEKPPRR